MAERTAWQPLANHLLIAIPERYEAPKGPRSPDGLAITLLAGEDSYRELEHQLRTGGQLQFETEALESERNKVCVGQVLQLPTRLDDQMVLHAAGTGARTFADITPVVKVGDTVYLDRSCLIDENEILPGIYRVSYAAVICVITPSLISFEDGKSWLIPIGGYVLLSRVWDADVVEETVEGRVVKCRKVGALITEFNVAPLPNIGIVMWVAHPLRGCADDLRTGQRVVITPGHALIETIAGSEYMCVRHDYILAVGVSTPLENLVGPEYMRVVHEYALRGMDTPVPALPSSQNQFSDEVIDASVAKTVEAIRHNPFTKEFQRIPLGPFDNAAYHND